MRWNGFLELLKATRIVRTFPILIVALIPFAYTNKFFSELFILLLVIVLIYSAAGIQNAQKDKDYNLPRYSKKFIFILILLALFIALSNKIIFIASLFAIFLGFVYNSVSRFMVMGDAFIAGLTHFVLPFVTSSLLAGLQLNLMIPITSLLYLIGICIGPITNLKDIKGDRSRNYKTLVNTTKKPITLSCFLFDLTFVFISLIYLLLEIRNYFLLLLVPLFILRIAVINQVHLRKYIIALNLLRFYLITSFVLLIFILRSHLFVVSFAFLIWCIYFLILFNRILAFRGIK